jgi:hypothetical protein
MVAPFVTDAVYGTDLFEVSGPVSPVVAVQVLLLLLELFLQEKITAVSNDIKIIFRKEDFILFGLIIGVRNESVSVSLIKIILNLIRSSLEKAESSKKYYLRRCEKNHHHRCHTVAVTAHFQQLYIYQKLPKKSGIQPIVPGRSETHHGQKQSVQSAGGIKLL